jgi:predicted membrane metal-binding protein
LISSWVKAKLSYNTSAVNAAVIVCVGIIFRRRVIPANALALAWLVVIGINPTDPFTGGCQLSFLSVFVMTRTEENLYFPRSCKAEGRVVGC